MKASKFNPVFFSVLVVPGCIAVDPRLTVVNQTGQAIAVEAFLDTIPTYPSLGQKEYYLRALLPNNKSGAMLQHTGSWPAFIKSSRDSRLHLVVYAADSINKYSNMDALIKHKAYKVYSFDKQYLLNSNWRAVIN